MLQDVKVPVLWDDGTLPSVHTKERHHFIPFGAFEGT